MEKGITCVIEGELTSKLRREYAKMLARILISEYGVEYCNKLLMELEAMGVTKA